jgi:hypothetical protein
MHAAGFGNAGHDFARIGVRSTPSDTSTGGPRFRSAGRLTVHVTQAGTPKTGESDADQEADLREPQTLMNASTTANRIDFTFDPTTSTPKPNCDEIVIIQSIQMNADGAPILPGTWYSPWKCRDAVCLADTTYIDHDCACTTPYYTYCFNGTPGASDGVTRNATSVDRPDATAGGDKRFRSPANPTGWTDITWTFETYAFCAAGAECGTWYDGVSWYYKKTDADNTAGRNGTSNATASLSPPSPGSRVVRAFNKFNSEKGFTPCVASVIPRVS